MGDGLKRPVGLMLWRGLRKRCPNCGAGGLFTHWFRLAEHCPGCGMRFEREEGFFLGALFINFVATQTLMFAFIVIAFGLTIPDPPTLAIGAGAVLIAIVTPLLGYPLSKTFWAAIHLAMSPLEPEEEADAAAWRFERGDAAR